MIPQGGEAVLAFGYVEPARASGHLHHPGGRDRPSAGHVEVQRTARAMGDDPVCSPDGTRLAFSESARSAGHSRCAVADADGLTTLAEHRLLPVLPDAGLVTGRPLHHLPGHPANGEPCADDNTTCSSSPRTAVPRARRLLAPSFAGFSADAAWSPSGTQIAFRATDEDWSSLWVADVTDPAAPFDLEAHRISQPGSIRCRVPEQYPRWSPDETFIASIGYPDRAPRRGTRSWSRPTARVRP